jgi:hypothetical protein
MSLKHVDIVDRVRVHILQPSPGNFEVQLECIEPDMNVVFDGKALETFNNIITEKCSQMSAKDPKTKMYIQEFVTKAVSEFHRNGLVDIVKAPKAVDDHYKQLRKKYENMRKRN